MAAPKSLFPFRWAALFLLLTAPPTQAADIVDPCLFWSAEMPELFQHIEKIQAILKQREFEIAAARESDTAARALEAISLEKIIAHGQADDLAKAAKAESMLEESKTKHSELKVIREDILKKLPGVEKVDIKDGEADLKVVATGVSDAQAVFEAMLEENEKDEAVAGARVDLAEARAEFYEAEKDFHILKSTALSHEIIAEKAVKKSLPTLEADDLKNAIDAWY